MINTVYNQDKEVLAQAAADALVKYVNEVLTHKDYAVIAIPGGNSVLELFNALKKDERINWKNLHFFMLDERLVDLENKDSNFKNAYENLFINLVNSKKLSWSNLHPFIYKPQDKDKGVFFYNEELKQFGGKFDIVIAGVGADGHTAAIFPKHETLDSAQNFITLDDSPKPPPERMSASPHFISQSDYGIVIFSGERKAQAYKNFNDDSVGWHDCPVKILKEIKNLTVITTIK